jgi:hypothetical protein
MLEEYRTLRDEIGRNQDHQHQIMNFAFVLAGAMVAFSAALESDKIKNLRAAAVPLLLLPPLFLLLAALYTERTQHIIDAADYIHVHLRRRVSEEVQSPVWRWEGYKADNFFAKKRRWPLLLDHCRWLVFVGPGAMSIVLYFLVAPWPPRLTPGVLGVLDILALGVAVSFMFKHNESSGVADAPGRESPEICPVCRVPHYEEDRQPTATVGSVSLSAREGLN